MQPQNDIGGCQNKLSGARQFIYVPHAIFHAANVNAVAYGV
jgi:hypothetical protein